MDYELLTRFTPRILAVYDRDEAYWQEFQYSLYREQTRLHTLAYVHAGTGLFEFGDQVFPLRPGHLFQVFPGQRMHITTSPNQPLSFYSIQFTYGLIHWEGTEMVWHDTSEPLPFPVMIPQGENGTLQQAYRGLFELWNDKNNGYEWRAKLAFYDILGHIGSLLELNREDSPGAADAVRQAIDYMKSHYREELSRDRLAEIVSLSPGYFSILFKKQTGFSPIQYLNKIRMDQAKHLLKATRIPVKQVAEEVGFPDSFYFTRMFTKETGMPPRDYRNA